MKQLYFIFIGLFFLTTASTCSKKVSDASKKSNSTKATFNEIHRPQFHFSTPTNWGGEPAGMVYHDGEYHLFYQHNPEGSSAENQHWGHAVSKDLTQWEHLPIALFPDSIGTILSGSVVMDPNNSSKFGSEENPPMVAMFTQENVEAKKGGANNFLTQGVAYSLDKGRTWEMNQFNPVLVNPGIRHFQNPKVFWHAETFKWVMVASEGDHMKIFASPNLTYWVPMTDFGKENGAHKGYWESPDLIPLSVEGIPDSTQWVLLQSVHEGAPNGGSGTQYFVGHFQGKYFFCDQTEALWMDYGRDNYAGTTWSDLPENNKRNLFIGWMNNWYYAEKLPTKPWKGSMTIPRELSMRDIDGKLHLISKPALEIENLRGAVTPIFPERITQTGHSLEVKKPTQSEIILEFDLKDCSAKEFGLEFNNDKGETLLIGFDRASNRFFVDRQKAGPNDFSPNFAPQIDYAPRFSNKETIKMRLFIDASSVELFADDGATVMSELFFASKPFSEVKLFANRGEINLKSGQVFEY